MCEKNIFLFEYATCGAFPELEPSITVEGLAMFKMLLEGFNDVSTFIDKRIPYFLEYPRVNDFKDVFNDYLERADASLIIAPEADGVLYNLTRELEKSGSGNLGSNSKGVKTASDKFLTYNSLKGINAPKTEIYNGKTSLDFPFIAKPRFGVSCDGVFLVRGEKMLESVPHGYLIQEFVDGKACSASMLIGDEIRILSINTQELDNFVYTGAKVPVRIEDTEEILRAVERINGLFGYVGVDFVWGDDISIIEINSRPTTPIVALNEAFGFNISELILKNYYHEKLPTFNPKKNVYMRKVRDMVENPFISFNGYSISLEELNEDIDL